MNSNNLHTDSNENQAGFTVPVNYFSGSRKQLLARINNGGMVVPHGYFEKSRKEIIDVITNDKPGNRLFKLKSNRWWYAAASLGLIGLISFLFLNQEPAKYADINSVSRDEIVNYFLTSENINDIPLGELYTNELIQTTKEDEEIISQLDEELLLNEL